MPDKPKKKRRRLRDNANVRKMDYVTIAVLAVSAASIVVLIVVICRALSGKGKNKNRYQNQSKNVLVRNGVDVKRQMLGGEKGDYFTGNLEKRGTYCVNPADAGWRIAFDHLGTKERFYLDFTRQMWIGRSAPSNGDSKVVITGDEKVSRNHCTIFDRGGCLYLQDLNSKNHTYLDGIIVTTEVPLQNGSILRIGDTQLKIQYCNVNDTAH